MNQGLVIESARQGLTVAMMVALPLLGASLAVGLVVSVFQAVTQIQEQTLTFVPKLLAAGAVVLGMGTWMLQMLVRFALSCFENAANVGQ